MSDSAFTQSPRTAVDGALDVAARAATEAALAAVLADQRPDGHWAYELEADATIPAEYVLMVHYLRRIHGAHGGWPLFHGGAIDAGARPSHGDDMPAGEWARCSVATK